MVLFIFFLFGCFLLETDLYAGTKDEDRPSYLSLKPLRHKDLTLHAPSVANPVYRLSAELLGTIATFMLQQEQNDLYVQNWACSLKGDMAIMNLKDSLQEAAKIWWPQNTLVFNLT